MLILWLVRNNESKRGRYKYVILYFDEEKKAIGIQFSTNDNEPHKFTIIKSKQGYGGNIVATSFFKKHNIDPQIHKGKYDWKKIKTQFGKLFVIELKKEWLWTACLFRLTY